MSIIISLRTLANGVNPDTGEKLPFFVSINKPTKMAYLLKLADELEGLEEEIARRDKKKSEKSEHFSTLVWTAEKIEKLKSEYLAGDSISDIAKNNGRTEAAAAYRLIVENVETEHNMLLKLSPETRDRVIQIIRKNKERSQKKNAS